MDTKNTQINVEFDHSWLYEDYSDNSADEKLEQDIQSWCDSLPSTNTNKVERVDSSDIPF